MCSDHTKTHEWFSPNAEQINQMWTNILHVHHYLCSSKSREMDVCLRSSEEKGGGHYQKCYPRMRLCDECLAVLCFVFDLFFVWIFLFVTFQFLNMIPKRTLSNHRAWIKDTRSGNHVLSAFSFRLERGWWWLENSRALNMGVVHSGSTWQESFCLQLYTFLYCWNFNDIYYFIWGLKKCFFSGKQRKQIPHSTRLLG